MVAVDPWEGGVLIPDSDIAGTASGPASQARKVDFPSVGTELRPPQQDAESGKRHLLAAIRCTEVAGAKRDTVP